jgi:hypothetical protein
MSVARCGRQAGGDPPPSGENMIVKNIGRALVVASAFLAVNAMANTLPSTNVKEMMSAKMMDANHDGMVSKAEFLAMAGKVYDMKAKEMSAKRGMMTSAQYQEMGFAIFQAFQQ